MIMITKQKFPTALLTEWLTWLGKLLQSFERSWVTDGQSFIYTCTHTQQHKQSSRDVMDRNDDDEKECNAATTLYIKTKSSLAKNHKNTFS